MTEEYIGAYVPWLFPNTGLSETESSWSVFNAIPLGPDKTKIIVRSKIEKVTDWEFYKQSSKSNMSWHGLMGGQTKYGNNDPNDPMATGDFMAEDVYACEQQQKSLKNPLFSVVATALEGESTVRTFQGVIERWMKE